MTMTDTEAKALALVNEVFMERRLNPDTCTNRAKNSYHEAICRAIEREAAAEARHAAELRELKERFSEALVAIRRKTVPQRCHDAFDELAAPFILPAPDPLVEDEDPIDALVDLLAPVLTHSQGMAARERENRFRNAIAALRAQQKDTNA